MKSLIVLCAGGRLINGLPIFLNRHPDGKLLAEKAIEGILAESYNRIYFTILKEANEKFRAILASFPNSEAARRVRAMGIR